MTKPTTNVAGKDTRKGESTLSSDVLDLLAAIRDALDVPLPGIGDGAERSFYRLMEIRRSAVHSTLAALLADPSPQVQDHDTRYLRRRTSDTPVTYEVWEPAALAERDGGEQGDEVTDRGIPVPSPAVEIAAAHPATGRVPGLCPPCRRGDCGECMAVEHPDDPGVYACHYVPEPHKACPRPGAR